MLKHPALKKVAEIAKAKDTEIERLRSLTVDKYDYDKLAAALANLVRWAQIANDAHHAGVKVTDETWALLYRYTNEARAVLSNIEPSAEEEESYDCPIHGMMKGEKDCPRC